MRLRALHSKILLTAKPRSAVRATGYVPRVPRHPPHQREEPEQQTPEGPIRALRTEAQRPRRFTWYSYRRGWPSSAGLCSLTT